MIQVMKYAERRILLGKGGERMDLSVLKTVLGLTEGPSFAVVAGRLALCSPEAQALGLADGQEARSVLAETMLPGPDEEAAVSALFLHDRIWTLRAVPFADSILCTLRPGSQIAPPPNEATLLHVAGSIRQALHDLNTALDGLAADPPAGGQSEHNAALAMRSVYRLRRTAGDLELFARLRSGTFQPSRRRWELVSATDRFCLETAELLRSGGLDLSWKLPEREFTALVDWPLTAALLRELLLNAAAHAADGEIRLELSRPGEHRASFTVRNRSKGGKPAQISFYRYAQEERADLEGGLGLGVSLVSQGAACLGGTLMLSMEENGETAAVLSIALEDKDKSQNRSPVQVPELSQDEGLTAFSPILPPELYGPDNL